MTDIESLRELSEKATRGPWEVVGDHDGRRCDDVGVWSEEAGYYPVEEVAFGNPNHRADAALIAAMRNALPDLLDELERLRAENEALHTDLEKQHAIHHELRVGLDMSRDDQALRAASLLRELQDAQADAEAAEGERDNLAAKMKRVEALAERGVGTDLNPTINLAVTDTAWWYSYLRRHDENWRHRLRAAIGGDDE